jgi:hypothetical protein
LLWHLRNRVVLLVLRQTHHFAAEPGTRITAGSGRSCTLLRDAQLLGICEARVVPLVLREAHRFAVGWRKLAMAAAGSGGSCTLLRDSSDLAGASAEIALCCWFCRAHRFAAAAGRNSRYVAGLGETLPLLAAPVLGHLQKLALCCWFARPPLC